MSARTSVWATTGSALPFASSLNAGPSSKAPRTASAVLRADDDRAGLGGLLEPRGDVHGVAGDERASLPCAAGHDLARVDADPQAEPVSEQLPEAPLHRERRVEGALRVILVRLGNAEHGHDRVARELLDRAARVTDLLGHRVVEALEHDARPLRVLLLSERRRADEIGEQHRGQLALGGLHEAIVTC